MSRPAEPASRRKHARVGHEAHRQGGLVQDLVPVEGGQRDLGRRDRPEAVPFEVVGVLFELRELPGADHDLGADQRRGSHLLVEVGVAVQGQLAEGSDQRGPEAPVGHEHRTGQLHAPLDVQHPQGLAGLPVGHPLVLGVAVGVRPSPGGGRGCRPRRHRRERRARGGWGPGGGSDGPPRTARRPPRPGPPPRRPRPRLSTWRASARSISPDWRRPPTSFDSALTRFRISSRSWASSRWRRSSATTRSIGERSSPRRPRAALTASGSLRIRRTSITAGKVPPPTP